MVKNMPCNLALVALGFTGQRHESVRENAKTKAKLKIVLLLTSIAPTFTIRYTSLP